jgi:phosphopantetheinyl transferase
MPLSLKKQTIIFTSLPVGLSSLASTLFPTSIPTAVILSLTHLSSQTPHTLTHWLHEKELTQLSGFSYQKRQREWLGGRICAKQGLHIFLQQQGKSYLLPKHHQYRVASEESGRPYFVQQDDVDFLFPHLSISHSGEYATAMISPTHCGIDIQYPAENLSRVKECFIKTKEEQLIHESLPQLSTLAQLALIWAGKEALKKMLSPTGIPGFHELTLSRVIPKNATDATLYFSGSNKYRKTFHVAAGIMNNGYSLALCCQQQPTPINS